MYWTRAELPRAAAANEFDFGLPEEVACVITNRATVTSTDTSATSVALTIVSPSASQQHSQI